MDKQLFITDFDGTLLNDERRISPMDFKILGQLQDAGVVTAIATGRSMDSFFKALDQMGLSSEDLPVEYLVFSTGAGVLSLPGRALLLQHDLSREQTCEICTYFDGAQLDYMVHRSIPHTRELIYASHGGENLDFKRRLAMYSENARPMLGDLTLFESATQVLAISPPGISLDRVGQIQADLGAFSVIHATSPLDHASSWIEVFNPRVSKSQSVDWLAQYVGVLPQNTIAVGNDYNDEDLLEWAGRSFMVDNGPEDLKGRFIPVASNNESGVAMAVAEAGLLG